jgi:cell division protein ZipA
MTNELRLILLGLSLVLLAGIWWWGARKSSQAPGNSELREPSNPEPPRREAVRETVRQALIEEAVDIEATPVAAEPIAVARDWGVPPFEPLSIRTAEYDRVPVLDGPMMVQADPLPAVKSMPLATATPSAAAAPPAPAPPPAPATMNPANRVPTLLAENSDRIAVAPPRVPNSSEQQKIISIRVCAPGESRWTGAALLAALESHGLAYGRYQVFHRKHIDGRSLFCVASLVEPGSFDVVHMAADEFRGVTLFAVLPGPVEPLLTIDELLSAARGLAQDLAGMVQDAKGVPLSPQRAAALRDDVARFQASLPGP